MDFLPHCKVTPYTLRSQGGFFIGSLLRERCFFFLLLSLLARPPRDCVRGTGGRELWLPRVTSRRFSHLQVPPELGPKKKPLKFVHSPRWTKLPRQIISGEYART